MSRRLATIAFWALAAMLLVANVLVCWHSLTVLRLWEDEAFNLTVPRNLLAGLGYTSDGTLSGSLLTPFDARISTGPAVLLPVAGVLATGIDPVIGARLVPLAYWALLVGGLWMLGRHLAGRWGGLAAAALPLAFNGALSVSPLQGPADLLGEVPAAALLVWAFVALSRRPWLAGLLFGLALQAKYISFLALPAFAVALFVLTRHAPLGARLLRTLRRAILPLAAAAVPTVLVELVTFVSLGPRGFVDHLRSVRDFLLDGGQRHLTPPTIPQKLETFAGSWFVPTWTAVSAGLIVAAILLIALVLSPALRGDHEAIALIASGAVGFLVFLGWWAQAASSPLWIRHPAVGLLAFSPLLAAAGVRAAQELWRGEGVKAQAVRRTSAALAGAALLLPIGVAGGMHAAQAVTPPTAETLAAQRAAAAPLASWVQENDAHWLAAAPWGPAVSAVVLTGAHVGLSDAPAMQHVTRLSLDPCPGPTLRESGPYRLCAAP
ncbi:MULTISPECIES: hypothetical protein [Bacteria]|uniref:hypothetical protein n=1 Tax=Bacteria TaxID=2 RepID=UPI003C7E6348